jgi:predicted N-acyltransferase
VAPFSLRIAGSIAEVPAAAWDALIAHEPSAATPFVRHAFLHALEGSGSASPRTGWRPRHLTLWRSGRLVAAAPAYRKEDSDGDFSRDWHWAAAARRAGVPYYPKLVLGVPFTPVTGRRALVAPGEDRGAMTRALVQGARELAGGEGFGALQVLFPGEGEARALEEAGLAIRLDFQYHWTNAGYRSPAQFLARFTSKRRSAIRRERAAPARQGLALRTVRGDELAAAPGAWADAMFELHRASVDRMPWGMRWVNRGFYRRLLEAMPDAVEIVEARRGGELVAAAFNLASPSRLYGRYWGCREEHPFLHFNVCLYHSIDECIRRGLEAFEGGAGGEHKLWRGFEPALTRSAHLVLSPRLDEAIRRHLGREGRERTSALERWRADSPVLRPLSEAEICAQPGRRCD